MNRRRKTIAMTIAARVPEWDDSCKGVKDRVMR